MKFRMTQLGFFLNFKTRLLVLSGGDVDGNWRLLRHLILFGCFNEDSKEMFRFLAISLPPSLRNDYFLTKLFLLKINSCLIYHNYLSLLFYTCFVFSTCFFYRFISGWRTMPQSVCLRFTGAIDCLVSISVFSFKCSDL